MLETPARRELSRAPRQEKLAEHDRAEGLTPEFKARVASGDVTFEKQMAELDALLRREQYEHAEDLSPEFKERIESGAESYETQKAELNERLGDIMTKPEHELLGRETGERLLRTEAVYQLVQRRVLERLQGEYLTLVASAGDKAKQPELDAIILARRAEILKEEQERFIRDFDDFDQQYADAVMAFKETEEDVRKLLRYHSVVKEDENRLETYRQEYDNLLDSFKEHFAQVADSFATWIDPQAERIALEHVKHELTEMEELRAEVRAFRQHA